MLPGTDDYNGAAVALHRLEDTYNLKPRDIRSGSLSKKYPSRELTGKIFIQFLNYFNIFNFLVLECFELGRIAYEKKDYYHTVHWMSEAIELADNGSRNSTVDKFTILDYLAFSTAQVNFK